MPNLENNNPLRSIVVRSSLIFLSLLFLVGCNPSASSKPLAAVSGRITLDGQPLPNARVGFEPQGFGDRMNAGPGSYGKTDVAGHYTLITVSGKPGAVPGMHRVAITTYKEDSSGEVVREEQVPERYFAKDRITFEVPIQGTGEASFNLTSPQEVVEETDAATRTEKAEAETLPE